LFGTHYVIGEHPVYVPLSILSGMIAICVMDRAIKFVYHFYLVTNKEDEDETPSKWLIINMGIQFILPLVILILHIPSMT